MKVVACVTAWCARNRHPVRRTEMDHARLSNCWRNGARFGRCVGRPGAIGCLNLRQCAAGARACGQGPCGAVSLGAKPSTAGPTVKRPRSGALCGSRYCLGKLIRPASASADYCCRHVASQRRCERTPEPVRCCCQGQETAAAIPPQPITRRAARTQCGLRQPVPR